MISVMSGEEVVCNKFEPRCACGLHEPIVELNLTDERILLKNTNSMVFEAHSYKTG